MNDVFGSVIDQSPGEFLQFKDCLITFSSEDINNPTPTASALLQIGSMTYGQNTAMFREIGSSMYYYGKSKSQGQLQIERLSSLDKSFRSIFEKFCSVQPGSNANYIITITSIKPAINWKYKLYFPIAANIGTQISADAGYVRENIVIAFSGLEKVQ